MDMASVELGGYELRYDTGSVYVTKNFFALLGAPEVDGSSLTVRTFGELLEHIQLVRPCTVNAEGDKVLTVVQAAAPAISCCGSPPRTGCRWVWPRM